MQSPQTEYKKMAKAAAGWVPIPVPPELVDRHFVMTMDDDYYDVKKT